MDFLKKFHYNRLQYVQKCVNAHSFNARNQSKPFSFIFDFLSFFSCITNFSHYSITHRNGATIHKLKSNRATTNRSTTKMPTKTKTAPAKKATAKKAVAAKPAATIEATAKPVALIHAVKTTYTGASAPLRGHGKKLSPIRLNTSAASFTERDAAFLRVIPSIANGKNEFKRGDIDAGALGRLITHGLVAHVSGDLALRDCVFKLTADGVARTKPVSASK